MGLCECLEDVRKSIKNFLEITTNKKVYVVMHVDLLHVANGEKFKTRLESRVEQFSKFESFYRRAIIELENRLEKMTWKYTLHNINKIVIKCLSLV